MEKLTQKRHNRFATTNAYNEALLFMKFMVTRGKDARSTMNSADLSEDYNIFTLATTEVQIINYLAYACNKMADFSNENDLKNFLDGAASVVKKEDQELFEKIVSKMKSKKFLLIPLMFGIEENANNWKAYNSLLIKCEIIDGGDREYIDMMGHVYRSFEEFLDSNKLPLCILYYPPGGVMRTDENGEIVLSYKTVGVMNTVLTVTDAAMATFGLFGNFLISNSGNFSSAYFTIRGIHQLYDSYQRGQSLNPFEDSNARNNWFQVVSNILYIASVGMQMKDICGMHLTNSALQACGNITVTTVKILCLRQHWNQMALGQQVAFGAALCFASKEVITMENITKLLDNLRMETLCKTFSNFTPGRINVALVKHMLKNSTASAVTLLNFAQELVAECLEVSLTPDLVTISILDHKFVFENFINLNDSDLEILIKVLRAIGRGSIELFSVMHQNYGLVPLLQLINNRSADIGDNFTRAFNQTLAILNAFRHAREGAITEIDPTNQELVLRTGQRLTINRAVESLGDDPGASPALRDLVGE